MADRRRGAGRYRGGREGGGCVGSLVVLGVRLAGEGGWVSRGQEQDPTSTHVHGRSQRVSRFQVKSTSTSRRDWSNRVLRVDKLTRRCSAWRLRLLIGVGAAVLR